MLADQPPAHPQGFGGWLLLPAFGVCVGPLRTISELVQSFDAYGKLWNSPKGRIVVAGELTLNLAFLTLQIVVLVVMLNKFRTFPRLFTWMWVAAVMMPVADLVLVMAVYNVSPADLLTADFARTLASTVALGFWVWYINASVRVENTFTR